MFPCVPWLTFLGVFTLSAVANPAPLTLWYPEPAREAITEALPVGNGRLGALVEGGTAHERLLLNEDTLWAGGPYNPVNPEALAALPQVRRLIAEGKYREAADLAGAKMMAQPLRQAPFQPLGELKMDFPGHESVTDYRRELDLTTACTTVRYRVGNVAYTREIFVSAPDQVIVVRLSADRPGMISTVLRLGSPQPEVSFTVNQQGIELRGRNFAHETIPGALTFNAGVRIIPEGGRVAPGEKILTIREADAVTVLISARTSFRSWNDVSGQPYPAMRADLNAAAAKSYAELRRSHLADYQPLFERFTIQLGASTERSSWPTDKRVAYFADGRDSELAALYVQFARYLLLACSRPGSQPANLQGLWNDQVSPPWGSKYTININTEMNYWPAEAANLSECTEPLRRMVAELADSGRRTAQQQYGARGWVAHHNTDLWRATAPIDGVVWGMWPMGGAWLSLHLWDHYAFTGDRAFLATAYPTLKGAAEFFLDTLVEEPKHGWLVTSPSMSPENAHHDGLSITAGPAMDTQLLRDLFSRCIDAASILDLDPEFRSQLAAARSRLAPDQIGRGGQLQEWLEDWDLDAPDPHHRHVSHLYALFPSDQISPQTTPELAQAARRTLELRGDEATGWSLAWKINLWARLFDGDRAYHLLTLLLSPERTYPNLFDAHPPFQIDGNFGAANGVFEMVLQSQRDEIHLLPALPSAWPDGKITGLRARGGLTVDLEWNGGRLSQAWLTADQTRSFNVRITRGEPRQVALQAGQRTPLLP